MAALIAPGVVRYAINSTMDGRNIVSLIDIHVDNQDPAKTREQAVFDVCGDVLNNWDDHILPLAVNNLTAVSVSWVDLDSETGSTGERQTTSANTWPKAGSGTSQPLPINTCALVTKVAPGGGRSARNGRLYLAGGNEDWTTDGAPNTLVAAAITAINTGFANFRNGIDDGGLTVPVHRTPVVVHTRNDGTPTNPDIVYVGRSTITAMTVQTTLATQRRRLRR